MCVSSSHEPHAKARSRNPKESTRKITLESLPVEIVPIEATKRGNFKLICAEIKPFRTGIFGKKDQKTPGETTMKVSVKCVEAKKKK